MHFSIVGFRNGEESDAKNTLTFKAAVILTPNSEVSVGDDYWFGFSMYANANDLDLIYSQQVPITADIVTAATMVRRM